MPQPVRTAPALTQGHVQLAGCHGDKKEPSGDPKPHARSLVIPGAQGCQANDRLGMVRLVNSLVISLTR